MGVVLLARDLTLERPVAIKLLPPHLAAEADLRARFLRETRTAAGLSHPNIVPIYAIEERAGLVYYVMGYIEGETLSQRVRRAGPLSVADAARLMQEAAWALSYAHGREIVHRDVKADNILLERATGRAFLTDFGIARVASATTMTAVGETLGTPQFMSPEQAAGERVDGRSDLYSLGVVAFFALTARLPFEALTVQATLAMHLTQPAPPVASLRPGLPAKLAAVVDRLLAKDPADRFPSGEAVVAAIQSAQAPVTEVAPQVRAFLRGGEIIASQVVTVSILMLVMAQFRPAVSKAAAGLAALFAGVALLQIVSRARGLLADGFGYGDVHAAFAAEARERDELLAWAQDDPAVAGHRRVGQRLLAAGTAALLAGAVVDLRFVPRPPWARPVRIVLATTALALFLAALVRMARDPRTELRLQRFGARLWMSRLGAWTFALAGMGVREVARPTTRSGGPQVRSIGALLAALPGGTRKQLGDARRVVALLQQRASALADRERELERALAEAGGDNHGAPAGDALGSRRHALVAELDAARRAAADKRAEIASALESIRLQLIRVGSGVGRPEELVADVESARRLAEG